VIRARQEFVRENVAAYDAPMNADEKRRARARLSLRAERAFGLNSASVPQAGPSGPGPQEVSTCVELPIQTSADLFVSEPDVPTDAFTAAPLKTPEKTARLLALDNNEVRGCTRCRLCETRKNTVFGEGDPNAKIFFIGEGPGENEDLQGRPFVGRAGELLNKWIAAMGLQREQVYIANIVKCRPPQNREPAPDEVATCTPYLQRQLEIIRPQVIITLGRPAAQHMLQTKISMGKLRAQWHAWRGIKLMPTYHPAYVLRSYTYETRSAVWNDLQMVMRELGLAMPKKKSAE
jgi:uracil-DNA glycosylase